MQHIEAHCYHALTLAHKSNYKLLAALYEKHGSWRSAHTYDDGRIDCEKEGAVLIKKDIQLILLSDKNFPDSLRHIPFPPHGLYIKGTPLSKQKKVAIVGTRKATTNGLRIAREFAKTISEQQVAIVSGLALGIDGAAHEGALDVNGITIAVLARGLDEVYPRQHEQLAKKIITQGGTLISEYPIGMPPLPHMFLERNRIVAGLCEAIVIIEAPKRSGTLATARFAVEQNREVFVIPGPIHAPQYEGSHELIKSGARLITRPEEVLQELGIKPSNKTISTIRSLAKNENIVLNVLNQFANGTDIDTIRTLAKIDERTISEVLATLVIEGIVSESMGIYRRA